MPCIPSQRLRSSDILPGCSASLSQRLPFTGALIHYPDALHPLPRDSLPFTGALVPYPDALHLLTETPSISRSSDILPGCSVSLSQRLSFTGALIHYPDALHPLPRDSLPFTGALVPYPDALHLLTETPSISRSSDILPGCSASLSQILTFTGALIHYPDALHPFPRDSHLQELWCITRMPCIPFTETP